MHIRMRTMLAVGALFALTLPTLAQPPSSPRPGAPGAPGRGGQPGQGRRGRGLSLAMLPVSVIDTITPLNAAQKTKITAIQTKARADMQAATDRTARGGIMTQATNEVKAVLTPAQSASIEKAMPTLMMVAQSRAIPMGALADVKLTKSQMTKISGFASSAAAQMKNLSGQERQAKMEQIGPQLKTQIEGVLTKAQKDAIAKYEAAHPRGQRGGGGGFGGGRRGAGAPPGAPGGGGIL